MLYVFVSFILLGGVLSPSEQPVEVASLEVPSTPNQVSIMDPIDMDETL